MTDYLQNIDEEVTNSLSAKGVSQAGIDGFLKGIHQSGRFENITRYWKMEGAVLEDLLVNMDLFKANWGKWHVDGDTVVFDDPQAVEAYRDNMQKLKEDMKNQQDAQKLLLANPSGQ
jgi:hypothetical protein